MLCDEADSKSKKRSKLNIVVQLCCLKRLFCDIHSFRNPICDSVSQCNDDAKQQVNQKTYNRVCKATVIKVATKKVASNIAITGKKKNKSHISYIPETF